MQEPNFEAISTDVDINEDDEDVMVEENDEDADRIEDVDVAVEDAETDHSSNVENEGLSDENSNIALENRMDEIVPKKFHDNIDENPK